VAVLTIVEVVENDEDDKGVSLRCSKERKEVSAQGRRHWWMVE
jgi:hypothetical protein